MININELAICDLLKHTELGIVSYQPRDIRSVSSQFIAVRDINFKLYWVFIGDCELPTGEEGEDYWEQINLKEHK